MLFVQGYLAYQEQLPLRTLQKEEAEGPVGVLGREIVSYERGNPVLDHFARSPDLNVFDEEPRLNGVPRSYHYRRGQRRFSLSPSLSLSLSLTHTHTHAGGVTYWGPNALP